MLTKKQKEVFDYIDKYTRKNSYAPSLHEIRKHFKLASVSTAHHYIDKLNKLGLLNKENQKARSIELVQNGKMVSIPIFGLISAGSPIEAINNPEQIQVPENMVSDSGKHYALKVAGDSMIDEGIFDGDTVVIREQSTVRDGESAVAYLPEKDSATLKKIYKQKNRIKLQPANPKLKPFYETNVQIQGKVVGVLRSF
jgi:repressor LexA